MIELGVIEIYIFCNNTKQIFILNLMKEIETDTTQQ